MMGASRATLLRSICPAIVLCALAGCTTVLSPSPVGSAATPLDPAAWDGAWHCTEPLGSPVFVSVTSPEAGELSIAWVWRDTSPAPGSWQLEETWGAMREGPPGFHVLSIHGAGSAKHLWMLAKWDPKNVGEGVTLWFPNGDVFRQLVEQGRLAGEYQPRGDAGGEVMVELSAAQLDSMVPRHAGQESAPGEYIPDAFYWAEPVSCARME
jgi:hypothetical protein